MTNTIEQHFQFENPEQEIGLVGPQDAHLKLLEEGLGVQITGMGAQLTIIGSEDAVAQTIAVVEELYLLIKKGIRIGPADIVSAMNMVQRGTLMYFADMYTETIIRDAKGRAIRVKNYNQREYVNAIRHADVTFGVGPAGTGKTYLAVAMAVASLKRGDVERLIITRPAVEAGESLGFLPGDLKEEVDPYLRPIYDALFAILGKEHTERLIDREVIEIAPLAYMRGRTLDNAFIILDEAQNTTTAQMKMFLTRLGFGSKMVVNGDVSQIDLPPRVKSGLVQAQTILQDVPQIQMIHFDASDVVRHPIVAAIVGAYDHYNEKE
ncbi:phosphate starvation protein PhoH [Weissella viridescens]|uniref:PhoH-like protein n=1 Tax=Weissella viridescens TaxID=1629 RepID=A0A0R2GZS2_WEIVI|nr:PhoH family protein [Weissella viridescens]KRN46162.1 phosphate starvation-inducible protein phoh, atpase [Weissella viridescens]GEA95435.1 phosphate starvation protein PhoH [Weissella viridescens]